MQSKELLNIHGFENVSISGDTRFDRVMEICSNPKEIELARIFKGDSKVMVIGSSWPDDMDVLLPIINDNELNLKYIIAPHEIGESKISKLCAGLKANFQLFSKADTSTLAQSNVLVIDNIGMLSSLYQYGEIAYIGGAFGAGLHNILEAATFGMPIIFGNGKDNAKYQEASDLVKKGGAFEVSNSEEIRSIVTKLLGNETELETSAKVSREYVISKTGATKMIMDFLTKYF
jgi:3-deoxy-D-manno-octulosonic-acid transferase